MAPDLAGWWRIGLVALCAAWYGRRRVAVNLAGGSILKSTGFFLLSSASSAVEASEREWP